jgi:Skp family chaperone for outer membrane proteins
MNKYAFGTALAVLAAAIPSAAPAQRLSNAVIAVVDVDRVFRECTACRAAQTQLEQQVATLRTRAQQLGQPLQTEQQSLEAAVRALAGKTPDAALQARITAFQTRQNTANQELQTQQATLQRNQQYVAQQINARLTPIYTALMGTRGATIVIEKNATLANAPAVDITNDVLAQLNQQLPSVATVAPAAAPAQQQPQGR